MRTPRRVGSCFNQASLRPKEPTMNRILRIAGLAVLAVLAIVTATTGLTESD